MNNIKFSFFIFIFWLYPLTTNALISSNNSEYKIVCGIASKNGKFVKIIKETRIIPFITAKEDPSFYFGCTIRRNKKGIQTDILEIALTAPKTNQISSNINYTKKEFKNTINLTYTPRKFKNFSSIVFRLNEGDQAGEYKLSLRIKNKFDRQIIFQIVVPGS